MAQNEHYADLGQQVKKDMLKYLSLTYTYLSIYSFILLLLFDTLIPFLAS